MEYLKKIKLKNNMEIILRLPQQSDAADMQKYINDLVSEDVKILKNEKIDLFNEVKYLDKIIEEIRLKKSIHILALYKGRLIGKADVKKENFRNEHIGSFGITVKKEFRGIGLGGK